MNNTEILIAKFNIDGRNYELVQTSFTKKYFLIRDGNVIAQDFDPNVIMLMLIDQISAMEVGSKRPW